MAVQGVSWARIMAPVAGGDADAGVLAAAAALAAPFGAEVAADALLLEPGDLRSFAPLPPDSAYKGSRGKVAVFAGSKGASGAAVLASRSCLAAGAGIVSLFASEELYPIAASMLDAVMVKAEPEDLRRFDASRFDAILVGPGWGRGDRRMGELAALLELGLPMVIDADAMLFGDFPEAIVSHDLIGGRRRDAGDFAALQHVGHGRARTRRIEML